MGIKLLKRYNLHRSVEPSAGYRLSIVCFVLFFFPRVKLACQVAAGDVFLWVGFYCVLLGRTPTRTLTRTQARVRVQCSCAAVGCCIVCGHTCRPTDKR